MKKVLCLLFTLLMSPTMSNSITKINLEEYIISFSWNKRIVLFIAKENYIEIARNPIAYFTIDPENPTILNPEVQFYDKSKGIINKWSWNFSGFEASSKQNPKFTFPESTKDKYMVKLEVTDTNTCVGDTLIAVFVGPEFSFYVPSAFTPNGDGLNDVWKPVGSGLNGAKYEMIVFDRWGQLVFKTNDLDHWS